MIEFFKKRNLFFRQLAYYIIFGLILGYSSLFFITLENNKIIFSQVIHFLEDIINDAEVFSNNEFSKWEDDHSISLFNTLNKKLSNQMRENTNIFIYEIPENKNVMIKKYKYNLVKTDLPLEIQNKILLKIEDKKSLLLRQDKTLYLIYHLDLKNSSLENYFLIGSLQEGTTLSVFRRYRRFFILFTLLVILLSYLLGLLFSYKIIHPIRDITAKVEQIAKGNRQLSLSYHQKNDLGTLALSIEQMNKNLNHRINTMKTLSQIDQSVFFSDSKESLLLQIMGHISEQYPNSSLGLFILNEKKSLLELKTLVKPSEKVKVIKGEFVNPKEVPSFVKSQISKIQTLDLPSRKKLFHFFPNLFTKDQILVVPLFQEKKFKGVFTVSLKGPNVEFYFESLTLLSNQVGMALQSLGEKEKREDLYKGLFLSLSKAIDAKSSWTAGHSERVAQLAIRLNQKLKEEEKFHFKEVYLAGVLHDIGKIGISSLILDKPGKLTKKEYEIIKTHPQKGAQIIDDIPDINTIKEAILYHHEHFDGSGYPKGLKGDKIPLLARILTICDIYDSIMEDRPYRKGFGQKESLHFLQEKKGTLLDPHLTDLFISLYSKENSIENRNNHKGNN